MNRYKSILSLIGFKSLMITFVVYTLLPAWTGGWSGTIEENYELVMYFTSILTVFLLIDLFLMWGREFSQLFVLAFGLGLFAGIFQAMLDSDFLFIWFLIIALYNLLVIVIVLIFVPIDNKNQKINTAAQDIEEMEKETEEGKSEE